MLGNILMTCDCLGVGQGIVTVSCKRGKCENKTECQDTMHSQKDSIVESPDCA